MIHVELFGGPLDGTRTEVREGQRAVEIYQPLPQPADSRSQSTPPAAQAGAPVQKHIYTRRPLINPNLYQYSHTVTTAGFIAPDVSE